MRQRYKLVATLDRGGMGELLLAELHEVNAAPRYVVVKRLLAELLDDDKYLQMFISEAEVMSKLAHPNIVKVFDTPVIEDRQCLAMEYVRGKNVQQILARLGELERLMDPPIVLRVMSQVLRGLEYAHNFHLPDGTALNLVHRDVTPGNVLLSFDGDVKLTDFGIAKHEMSAMSTTVGIVKGKARYLAPEQILGEKASPRSDVFSAAAVTVEMLTGVPVFERGTVPKTLYAIVNGERDSLEHAIDFRAPLLVQVLNRALAVDPRQRLQTAKELAEGLDAAARQLGRPHDREAVGAFLRGLYADVDDALLQFRDPPPSPAVELRETMPEEGDESALTVQAAPLTVPVSSPSPSPSPEPVDEALSVLAWLQARHVSSVSIPAAPLPDLFERSAVPPISEEPPREEQPTAYTQMPRERSPVALVFALGAVCGVLLTLGMQAFFREPRAPKPPPVIATPAIREPEPMIDEEAEPAESAGFEPALPVAVADASPVEATFDLLEPKGARVRVDGVFLKQRVPLKALPIKPGKHEVKVYLRRMQRELSFDAAAGEHVDLTPRLRGRRR